MNDSVSAGQKKRTGPKYPVQKRGQRQRNKLLRTAREVFRRLGYVDTRVADIAREAGVAHGTFYTYFDSREDVLLAIARVAYRALMAALAPGDNGVSCSRSLPERMTAYVSAFQEYVDVISTVEQAAAVHSEIKAIATEFRAFLVALIEKAIADHAPARQAKKTVRVEAWAAYGAIDALLHAWQTEGGALTRRTVLAQIDNVLTRCLAASSELLAARAQTDHKPQNSRSMGGTDA